jgi:hypothetical protein
MKVCGVDLKGNDAIVCMLSQSDGLFNIPDCRVQKLSVNDANDKAQLIKFQQTFVKLMMDYGVDHVVIRARAMRGKFAGGAVGFKIETALQLADGLDVIIFSPTDIKASLKRSPLPIEIEDTDLKKFQETAFTTAYAFLNR